jgi:hypothetical protein
MKTPPRKGARGRSVQPKLRLKLSNQRDATFVAVAVAEALAVSA